MLPRGRGGRPRRARNVVTAACWAHRCLLGAPLPVGALRIGFGAKDLIWHVRDVTRLESRSDQWACGSGCEHGTGSSHHCCMRTRGWGANPTAVRSWTHDTCTSRRCGVKGPLTAVRSPVARRAGRVTIVYGSAIRRNRGDGRVRPARRRGGVVAVDERCRTGDVGPDNLSCAVRAGSRPLLPSRPSRNNPGIAV